MIEEFLKSELVKKYLSDLEYIKKNAPKQYAVLTIDLTIAHNDQSYDVLGNSLTATILPTEANKYVKIRLNSKENDQITLKEGRKIETTIHSIFLTNTPYTSGILEIVIGIGLSIDQ